MENLTLDFNNFGSRVGLGTYEKCDSLTLNIMLDEKDYTGYKFKIVAKKSDGHIIEQDIKELEINREEKTIKIELNNQFTTKEGIVKLEINMIKDGKEDTTKEAFFIVRDTINGEVVESASIIPTLQGVKVFIDEAVSSLGDLEQVGKDITLINGEFKEAEIKRKANELLRERSEKERVRLESIRTTEEADRIKAEAERKEAENNRKVAESNRKLAENTRKTNEAARVEAELNRQSLFEENEEIRNGNENLRIEAEKERKVTFSNNNKFESERVEAEKLRTIAEDKRVTAEKARVKAEEERVKAETRRESTYTDFNDSEVERKNNEANRVRAEAERVNAESGRNELFNSNEEKRNNTFVESERARERAFNEAQTNRSEAYEESERVREEAFKVSETARNEAEEGRVAEELLRVKVENNRKVAEGKRVETESARVETEKLRVSAETERVEAENLRVIAEEGRVAAETKREEGFNTFEGKINANTEELKNARSATTGEEFNSLDERIDCEVDRLNKKIEVSMLQQEDKESHVVENTVEGMTTDMIIKGRTLQNLAIKEGYYINPNGTQQYFHFKKYKSLFKAGNYTLKNVTGKVLIWDISRKDNDEWIKSIKSNKSIVINLEEGQYVRNIQALTVNGWTLDENTKGLLEDNVVILEGDKLNIIDSVKYFEEIKSFGEENNKISILSHGKNLINESEFEDNTLYYMDTGKKQSNSTYKAFSLKVIPNKNYYFTIDSTGINQIALYKNGVWKHGFYNNKTKLINGDYDEIKISVVKEGFVNIQLEEGTQSSSYEPYKCDKKDILLGKYGFDEGLGGIEHIFDELNSIRNVAIKRIERYTFNGEEMWDYISAQSQGNTAYFQTNLLDGKVKFPSPRLICDTLKAKVDLWNVDDIEGINVEGNIQGASCLRIRILKSKLSTTNVDGLKAWLKANPTTICYELAEPIETPLDENINLKAFNEKTYVSFENAIGGTSSFKAPVNTIAAIARLNRENRALEEENVKLKAGTYKNAEDITITNEELQATQSAVDFLLFSNLNASESSVLYNGKKEGGGSMGAYLAMRIIKGNLKYDAVMKQYGEFKEDIDLILEAEGYGHLITQQ